MKKVFKVIGIVVAVFFAIGIIASIAGGGEEAATKTESEAGSNSEEKSDVAASKWKYSESTDQMDNKVTHYATLQSENKVDFQFPYNGGSSFNFIVRKTNGKREFVLTVSKGQFMLNIMGDEKLRIKFDEGETFEWTYLSTNNGNTEVIFPEYSDDFLSYLKKSKKMMVEAPFALDGRQVIQFKTENLQADF